MTVNEIKSVIRALPDDQVGPLLEWMQEYYDGEVWDRQIVADIERMGLEQWEAALTSGMAKASAQRQAALRLLNSMRFSSAADRDQCIADIETILGEALV